MARRYFQRHIDPDVLQKHIDPGDYGTEIELGEYIPHECAVVFFDLVNFTNISWSLTTPRLMSVLKPFFERASDEIWRHGGMVDKFPGDGVVGFFPRSYSEDKNEIVDKTLDCTTKVMHWFYNSLRPNVTLPKPSHTLELCAGIDAGNVAIAHVGSALHSELILLGDQVNCASKCQAAASKREVVVGQDAKASIYYKGFYGRYFSTGPDIGVVYSMDNRHYLSYRFDWEQYASEHEWARS